MTIAGPGRDTYRQAKRSRVSGIRLVKEILIANDATGVQYPAKTNGDGFYLVTNLPPGTYRLQVSNSGFKTIR
jgi:hypothetical protein